MADTPPAHGGRVAGPRRRARAWRPSRPAAASASCTTWCAAGPPPDRRSASGSTPTRAPPRCWPATSRTACPAARTTRSPRPAARGRTRSGRSPPPVRRRRSLRAVGGFEAAAALLGPRGRGPRRGGARRARRPSWSWSRRSWSWPAAGWRTRARCSTRPPGWRRRRATRSPWRARRSAWAGSGSASTGWPTTRSACSPCSGGRWKACPPPRRCCARGSPCAWPPKDVYRGGSLPAVLEALEGARRTGDPSRAGGGVVPGPPRAPHPRAHLAPAGDRQRAAGRRRRRRGRPAPAGRAVLAGRRPVPPRRPRRRPCARGAARPGGRAALPQHPLHRARHRGDARDPGRRVREGGGGGRPLLRPGHGGRRRGRARLPRRAPGRHPLFPGTRGRARGPHRHHRLLAHADRAERAGVLLRVGPVRAAGGQAAGGPRAPPAAGARRPRARSPRPAPGCRACSRWRSWPSSSATPTTPRRCTTPLLPYADLPVMGALGVVCFGSAHRALGAGRARRAASSTWPSSTSPPRSPPTRSSATVRRRSRPRPSWAWRGSGAPQTATTRAGGRLLRDAIAARRGDRDDRAGRALARGRGKRAVARWATSRRRP